MAIITAHPLVVARLIWMRDNQPNLLMQQWEDGTLSESVHRTVKEAVQNGQRMLELGVDRLTMEELRLNEVAPAEGMDASRKVRQIPDKIFRKIVKEVT